ncbi:MAG: cytochrome c-type biogenesis protein [Acidimicrobiales bacterium]
MKRFSAGSREAWAFVLVSLIVLLAIATFAGDGAVTDGERAEALNDQFACPTCDGQSVAESNAAVAATIRQFIRDEIDAGATDTDIRNALIDAYGTEVLLNPPSSGVATLVWVLPVLVLVGGSAIVASSITRNRTGSADPSADDKRIVSELRRKP